MGTVAQAIRDDPSIVTLPWIDRSLGKGDRYRISKCLSMGGMGEVYLAIDTKLNQPVALKLLKQSQVKSAQMYQRFRREVELCAALNSEQIVKILAFGATSEGFPCYGIFVRRKSPNNCSSDNSD